MQFGKTALMCSAEYGHLEVAKLLLDRNANIEAKDYVRPRDMMSGRGGLLRRLRSYQFYARQRIFYGNF